MQPDAPVMDGRSASGSPGAGLELPPVIGHRGAAGCAPENTIAGLRRAAALGCGWVEFDVRLTADGEPVLLHDERLERTTDGRGRVRALPLSTIRRCDAGLWFDRGYAGERVPTLAEAIAALSALRLGANIEIKAPRRAAAETAIAVGESLLCSWPSALPAPLISSFAPAAVAAARECAPTIARGLLLRRVAGNWRSRAERLACATINADHRLLRPAIVAEIVKAGYLVLAYTVNDAVRARELFDWGVTSVFSDVPQLVLAALPDGRAHPAAPAAQSSVRQGALS